MYYNPSYQQAQMPPQYQPAQPAGTPQFYSGANSYYQSQGIPHPGNTTQHQPGGVIQYQPHGIPQYQPQGIPQYQAGGISQSQLGEIPPDQSRGNSQEDFRYH